MVDHVVICCGDLLHWSVNRSDWTDGTENHVVSCCCTGSMVYVHSDSLAGVGVAVAAAHWLVVLVPAALQLAWAQQTAEALINMSSCRQQHQQHQRGGQH